MTQPNQRNPKQAGHPHKARKARLKVDLWCELLGGRERAVGHIRNMSVAGCRVLSPSAFPIRQTISLVLAGPAAEPDLLLKAQIRWIALNPEEGPFELGFQFVHSGGSESRVEQILKGVIRRISTMGELRRPTFSRFTGGLEAARIPGTLTAADLRRIFAAEGLDRLIRPGPSSPLP